MHPVPFLPCFLPSSLLPYIFLTLPFQSEFQIPQVQIPHPNFPSHPNLRTLSHLSRTLKEIRRPVTGYRAPVRIRSAAWSSASPDGREVGRLAAVHPIVGLLLVCASRTSRLGAAPLAPRRCTSRARSTSTRRYIEQGERRTASLVHRAVVRTSRSSLRQRSSSCVVKLGLRSSIRTRFVVHIVGTLIVRAVTPRRSRTPSHSRSDSAWSASCKGLPLRRAH